MARRERCMFEGDCPYKTARSIGGSHVGNTQFNYCFLEDPRERCNQKGSNYERIKGMLNILKLRNG